MEGLLIADLLVALAPRLPAERGAWRFLDAHTYALPFASGERGALWFFNRPPNPRLELRDDAPPPGRSFSGFQDLLQARADGPLVRAEQIKLDRVVRFHFAASRGFVAGAPVVLVAELTGRNCNLILTDPAGQILGAAREVGADINRFRQVRSGLTYRPPPPYRKLDPRTEGSEALREALRGTEARRISKLVDGLGPELTRALLAKAAVGPRETLEGERLERAVTALEELTRRPNEVASATLARLDLHDLRERDQREALLGRVRAELTKRRTLLNKRLADADRAATAAAAADRLRHEGNVLLAFARRVRPGVAVAELEDFDGSSLTLELDPALDAVQNAQRRFERARKREARAAASAERRVELERELAELDRLEAGLEALSTQRLEALADEVAPQRRRERRRGPGVRYRGPHGFVVVVGRNARENDQVTFKVARSRDMWLHAQGYHGAHVVILAENREVPFDTILYAAQLAAAYSKAAGGDNVAVDYTSRKNVWKVKGMPAGAVHFTQHKTVYVTPDRHPEGGAVEETAGA